MLISLVGTEKELSCADLDLMEGILGGRLPPEFRRLYLLFKLASDFAQYAGDYLSLKCEPPVVS